MIIIVPALYNNFHQNLCSVGRKAGQTVSSSEEELLRIAAGHDISQAIEMCIGMYRDDAGIEESLISY
jgi:hypothetical protein